MFCFMLLIKNEGEIVESACESLPCWYRHAGWIGKNYSKKKGL
jgi:hypothetical protein